MERKGRRTIPPCGPQDHSIRSGYRGEQGRLRYLLLERRWLGAVLGRDLGRIDVCTPPGDSGVSGDGHAAGRDQWLDSGLRRPLVSERGRSEKISSRTLWEGEAGPVLASVRIWEARAAGATQINADLNGPRTDAYLVCRRCLAGLLRDMLLCGEAPIGDQVNWTL